MIEFLAPGAFLAILIVGVGILRNRVRVAVGWAVITFAVTPVLLVAAIFAASAIEDWRRASAVREEVEAAIQRGDCYPVEGRDSTFTVGQFAAYAQNVVDRGVNRLVTDSLIAEVSDGRFADLAALHATAELCGDL